MIKLTRGSAPNFLTDAEVARLTADYLISKSAVWNDKRIKVALLESSHGKCAFCECSLTAGSNYMEVEHFAYKEKYNHEVITWSNLLPSCKRCNGSKGQHDVRQIPIVNPFDDLPRDHFELFFYRLRSKTQVGSNTTLALNLNHHERAIRSRFEIGEKVQSTIDDAIDKLDLYVAQQTTARRNKLVTHVEGLMSECLPSKPYAATAATVLHKSSEFVLLRTRLQSLGLWSAALRRLHRESKAICL